MMKKIIFALLFLIAFTCRAQLTAGSIKGTYSPAWTSTGTAPALGNGTLTGTYVVQPGGVVTIHIFFQAGSTTTFGTGAYRFSLPFAMVDTNPIFLAQFFSNATGHYYTASTVEISSTTFAIYGTDSGSGYGQGTPTTWQAANTTFFTIDGTYNK